MTVNALALATFALRLTARRQATLCTQAEIAALVGVHVATYRGWEHGALTPRDEHRARLARVFGVGELLGGERS